MNASRLSACLLSAALAALGLCSLPSAQIRSEGTPTSFWAGLTSPLPTTVLPAFDVEAMRAEDVASGYMPLRYGKVIETSIDLSKQGRWDAASDGTLVCRLALRSPGAYSLGLDFSTYQLPKGAQLYLYDAQHTTVFGAYTDLNQREDGGFVIEPFPGDALIVEYVQPREAQGLPSLVIGGVIHDYRNIFDLHVPYEVDGARGAGPGDGSCLIDVNCPQGANWAKEKRAVMRTLSGGALCSAALINNTNNDATNYVITANHCGQSASTVFLFNYQTSGCGTGSAPQNQSLSGCQVLTNNGTYDGRFLKLNGSIPSAYQPYYVGWSRATTSFTQGTSIGHPSGGPKKISIDANGATLSSDVWNLAWSEGMLEGGSSGGPAFDQNHRFRGQAWWVTNFNCGSQSSGYGRFDRFWTNNNLAQWLAPSGTPPTTLDGYDPFGPPPAPPTITNLTPNGVSAFSLGLVTMTGDNFNTATQVNVGSHVLSEPFGFTLVNNTQITFNAPVPSGLGSVPVTVTTSVGTSNSVNLSYNETNPPALAVPSFGLTSTTLPITYGGMANDISVLVYSGSNATFNFLGFPVLLNYTTAKVQSLDALGLGNYAPIVPPSALGLTLFFQLATVDNLTGAFVGASSIPVTTILF